MRQQTSRRRQKRADGIVATGTDKQLHHDLQRIEARESKRMDKRKRRFERAGMPMSSRKVLFLSFFFPFIMFTIAFACQGMWPIADTAPLTIDLYHQYAPFLAELRTKMTNFDSLFYSWNGGLGMNFYALIAYYLASPLNVLMILFPPNFLSEAVTVLTLLKIGLTGLTFSIMLREVFTPFGQRTIAAKAPHEVRYASETGTDWGQILISTAFALSGFMLAYSWDIMWLDTIIMLPLVIAGMFQLIKSGRFLLYVLSLAGAIIFNYYIAIFVCLFTAFYFFVLYISVAPDLPEAVLSRWTHFFKRFWQFAASSILAAMLSAFISIPTYLALLQTSASGDNFPSNWRLNFDTVEFVARHLIDMEPKIRSGLPNIYMGLIVFILLPIYVMAKNIRLSEKIAHLAMMAFLFMSFNSNVLNFIWHGMHYPNQLPYRFAFVYSFLVLIMMYRALSALRDMEASQIAMGAVAGILYTIMAERLLPDEVDHETAMVSILFIILLAAAISLVRDRKRSFRFMMQALACVMIAELLVNTIVTVSTVNINESYTRRSSFNGDFDVVRDELAEIEEMEGENSFYRTELIQQKTTNSPALYGYKGFTLFSSTSYETTAKLMRDLGYHGNNINSYKYMSSTAVLNSFFGIEYLIDKDKEIRDPLLETVHTENEIFSYRNPYALSLGFMVSENILNWNTSAVTPFETQNDLLVKSAGYSDVFLPLEIVTESAVNMNSETGSARNGYNFTPASTSEKSEVTMVITSPVSQHVYFHIDTSSTMDVNATVEEDTGAATDSTVFRDTRGINKPEIFDVGYVEAGETVRVKVNFDTDKGGRFKISAAGLNETVYTEAMTDLATGNMEITEYNSRQVIGTVDTDEAGILFLSIPYDESWQVFVDGEEQEFIPIAEGLSGVRLDIGTHDIKLKFTPPGFWMGLMITALGILIFLIALLLYRSTEGKREERARRARVALRQRRNLQLAETQHPLEQRFDTSTIRSAPVPSGEHAEENRHKTIEEAANELIANNQTVEAHHDDRDSIFPSFDDQPGDIVSEVPVDEAPAAIDTDQVASTDEQSEPVDASQTAAPEDADENENAQSDDGHSEEQND